MMDHVENNTARELPDEKAAVRIAGTAPGDRSAPDPMQDFLARSAARRDQQTQEPERYIGSWFDPDPAAITALPEGRHPGTRYLELTRASRREHKRSDIRCALAVIKGEDRRTVTWEGVLAYPWHHIGPDEARDYYRATVARYANLHTRHGYIAAVRGMMKRCKEAKLISAARYAEVIEELPTTSLRGAAVKRRRLTGDEIAALLTACQQDTPLRAARDAAMVAVFVTTGLRVSELVRLDLSHWDRVNEVLTLVMTKSGRDHAVPVDSRTKAYLEAWLKHRGNEPGPLLVGTEGMPRVLTSHARLSVHAVLMRVQLLATRSGIGHMGTHDFRRTVASTLLRTTDASLVGRLLNHANLATTLGYDMATEDEQRHAISTLPLPALADEQGADQQGDDDERRAS
jgi:integrase